MNKNKRSLTVTGIGRERTTTEVRSMNLALETESRLPPAGTDNKGRNWPLTRRKATKRLGLINFGPEKKVKSLIKCVVSRSPPWSI
jgi:hypothetical protein